MILLVHVAVAFASIVYSGWAVISPSKTKLRASYELVVLTLVSGTYLVLHDHLPLAQSCLTGLAYLAIITSGVLAARHRLARSVNF